MDSDSEYLCSFCDRMKANDESAGMRKEEALVQFDVLSWQLLLGAWGNDENPSGLSLS